MQSICPTCLLQVDHEEGALEVECSCGAKFDPSQQLDDLPSLEEAMQNPPPRKASSEPEPAAPTEIPSEASSEPDATSPENADFSAPFGDLAGDLSGDFGALDGQNNEPEVGDLAFAENSQPEPGSDFSEATQAFDEIREFGESVLPGQEAEAPASPLSEKPQTTTPNTPPAPTTTASVDGAAMRMTSGALLQGFKITEYFTPLSLQCAVKEDAEEPLRPAFDKLWAKAQALGGNGVIDLKWRLSADGSKVLISGTPVQCKKAE
ncbi:MAG: hypothetical protein R3B54_15820 [Bdellovibrionota bacterium]